MKSENMVRLLFSIVICQLAGIIGSLFTLPSIPGWYAALEKPLLAPPGAVIGAVWIILYFLMGVSLYLVLNKGLTDKKVKVGILFFAIQLILNTMWSFVFFGLKSPLYALIEIIWLWFAIFLTIYMFFKIDKRAAYLLLPYIVWVSFAAVLNYQIWILNA